MVELRVLESLGHQVEFKPAQTCCGQMHYKSGYQRESIPLVRAFLELYQEAEVVCVPSSSCAAMIREHYVKVARTIPDVHLARGLEALVPRVFEFTELLVTKPGRSCCKVPKVKAGELRHSFRITISASSANVILSKSCRKRSNG